MSEQIDAVLQSAVATGAVPSVVGLVADENGLVYEGAAGARVAGESEPVTPDTMLRIASMTKMITTVAALQLLERGHLDLEAPVDTYCPQFADLQVLDGFDGVTPRLRPPATRATVKQLITHTAGLGYWFFNENLVRWEQVTGTANILSGKREIFTAPLSTDPGTRFEYGTNIDWLGLVIESASQQPLDGYVRDNILEPLGDVVDDVFAHPRAAGRHVAGARAGCRRAVASHRHRLVARAGVVGRRARPVLHAAGVPAISAHAAARRRARWPPDPAVLDGRGRLHQPDRRARLPTHHHERRQVIDLRLQHWTRVEVGAGAVAQQRAGARNARSLRPPQVVPKNAL